VAGIMAAKNASSIIPYCHPLPIDFVGIDFETGDDYVGVTATVKAIYKTGVEMEALTAASVAALTMYDMLKMVDDTLFISEVRLLSKSGGKSDYGKEKSLALTGGIVVISDSVSSGKKSDRSGQTIAERLGAEGIDLAETRIIPDDENQLTALVREWCDVRHYDLIISTGGTGLSPRDRTPEAMQEVFEREIPGIGEAMRAYGQNRTPYAILSRGIAGIRGRTIIVNLPGSTRAVRESLDVLFPAIRHAFHMLRAEGHSWSTYGHEEQSS
jgi:cyclic pyranopterin phosphate synthase